MVGGVFHSLTTTELSGSHTWCLSSIMACSCASWPPEVTARPPLGVGTRVYLRVGVLACLLPGRDPPEEFGLKMSGNTGGRVASAIKPTCLSQLIHVLASGRIHGSYVTAMWYTCYTYCTICGNFVGGPKNPYEYWSNLRIVQRGTNACSVSRSQRVRLHPKPSSLCTCLTY